ncbi:MAG: gas vesicle protein GvpN [Oscillatoria sp. SIO1A7]|nr:gas vesicle protein GvpN [Oscillatoria sp. SIO1A7]
MTTVLQANPRGFVNTPAVERIAARSLRYLQSGLSVHLRGPAGTGKTTLALHLADMLGRPIVLIFGDEELNSSDLIGNNTGYTRKKVVDNFIHSVVKVEDELRHNWVDSRLTLACKEGFTLVYDEFNRSRPEVNNVLLSALEERLLILPPSGDRSEYIRVHPQFRAIFTSNPEEYCGVHDTQDALMDRLLTINMPEPDELTQQEILVQKTGIDRSQALKIVRLVKAFRSRSKEVNPGAKHSSPLRSCWAIAKVCHDHSIAPNPNDSEFRDLCADVLISRSNLELELATKVLWDLFNSLAKDSSLVDRVLSNSPLSNSGISDSEPSNGDTSNGSQFLANSNDSSNLAKTSGAEAADNGQEPEDKPAEDKPEDKPAEDKLEDKPEKTAGSGVAYEREVYRYLQQSQGSRVSEIQSALEINRVQAIDALRSLIKKGLLMQRDDRLYIAQKGKV